MNLLVQMCQLLLIQYHVLELSQYGLTVPTVQDILTCVHILKMLELNVSMVYVLISAPFNCCINRFCNQ